VRVNDGSKLFNILIIITYCSLSLSISILQFSVLDLVSNSGQIQRTQKASHPPSHPFFILHTAFYYYYYQEEEEETREFYVSLFMGVADMQSNGNGNEGFSFRSCVFRRKQVDSHRVSSHSGGQTQQLAKILSVVDIIAIGS